MLLNMSFKEKEKKEKMMKNRLKMNLTSKFRF